MTALDAQHGRVNQLLWARLMLSQHGVRILSAKVGILGSTRPLAAGPYEGVELHRAQKRLCQEFKANEKHSPLHEVRTYTLWCMGV